MYRNEFEDPKTLSLGKNYLLAAVNMALIGGGGLLGWHAYDLIDNHADENSPLWAMGYSWLGGYLILAGALGINKQLNALADKR